VCCLWYPLQQWITPDRSQWALPLLETWVSTALCSFLLQQNTELCIPVQIIEGQWASFYEIIHKTYSIIYPHICKFAFYLSGIGNRCNCLISLQNPTLGILVAGSGNVLGRQTGFWSTWAKMWGIVPKAAWHCGGDNSVTKDLFGAPGSTPSSACLPPAWGSADGDCLIPWFLWD
jgi:hypothetical protein